MSESSKSNRQQQQQQQSHQYQTTTSNSGANQSAAAAVGAASASIGGGSGSILRASSASDGDSVVIYSGGSGSGGGGGQNLVLLAPPSSSAGASPLSGSQSASPISTSSLASVIVTTTTTTTTSTTTTTQAAAAASATATVATLNTSTSSSLSSASSSSSSSTNLSTTVVVPPQQQPQPQTATVRTNTPAPAPPANSTSASVSASANQPLPPTISSSSSSRPSPAPSPTTQHHHHHAAALHQSSLQTPFAQLQLTSSSLISNEQTSNALQSSQTAQQQQQQQQQPQMPFNHGHFFTKKTFHKPTYCHHCTEMLWGLIGQGFVCEVCNFVCHEKCQKSVVSPCTSIAHTLIKNPVAHCWSEPTHFKRKFCNACRKRLEDNLSVRCEICEYYVHVDCQVLAVNDCCETATYMPNRTLGTVTHRHHWREGNLPTNSKCVVCKKTCWTSECLAGMKCEWCGTTAHSICRQRLIDECNFGNLRDIIIPPYAVSLPRVDMNKEILLGIQNNRAKVRSNSTEFPSSGDTTLESTLAPPLTNSTPSPSQISPMTGSQPSSPFAPTASGANNSTSNSTGLSSSTKKREKLKTGEEDEDSKEIIRVYDGDASFRNKVFRTITVPKNSSYQIILEASLRTFHINDDLSNYYLSIPPPPPPPTPPHTTSTTAMYTQVYTGPNSSLIDEPYVAEEKWVDETNPIRSIKTALYNSIGAGSSGLGSISGCGNMSSGSGGGGGGGSSCTTITADGVSSTSMNSSSVQPPGGSNSTSNANSSMSNNSSRPAIFLRYKDRYSEFIRIYPGLFNETSGYQTIRINSDTTVQETLRIALEKFRINSENIDKYYLVEVSIDQDVNERILGLDEHPLQIIQKLRKESLCNNRMVRLYLKEKEDPHGPSVALFVGNLPSGLSQIQYEKILMDTLRNNNEVRWTRFDVIYYEYGAMVCLYDDASKAVRAYKTLREASYENKQLMVLLLPTIQPPMIPPNVCPLLVFVNVKSGGQQGSDLITSFRHLLNPHQVFDLQNGGPLPGLYVFRNIESYRILACGGDGTIGWVLSCLDNVSQDAKCQSPPMGIVPLGTGNDLARVLRWGAGYTGAEEPINLLRDAIDAEEITLDRWTVVFSDENKELDDTKRQISIAVNVNQANTNEDNTEIFVMNNYFGIGIDADVCLDFHKAREENPNKFNSRLHNKKYYVQMALRKIMNRSLERDFFNKNVTLEVDGRKIDLPSIEGIIILNILSWGSGANPWGPEKESQFQKPTHYDGMLEVVGIRSVIHMGQIQSGLSSGIRIAQGGRIKIRMNADIPVQVDGEPWMQTPCAITILKSALKATMLKKRKIKMKRRNTEPSVNMPIQNPNSQKSEYTSRAETDLVDPDGESEPF